MTSGQKIREYRQNKQWSIAELSARSGIKTSSIYQLEVSDRKPNQKTLQLLSRVFGISMADLCTSTKLIKRVKVERSTKCDQIEAKLIEMGYCVRTNARFEPTA